MEVSTLKQCQALEGQEVNPIRSNIRLSPLSLVSVAAAFFLCAPANAEPGLETGTRDLRSDLELLEA
ncbi:hypothetical protein ABTM52_20135, partial [Acinetobacter baumannii]